VSAALNRRSALGQRVASKCLASTWQSARLLTRHTTAGDDAGAGERHAEEEPTWPSGPPIKSCEMADAELTLLGGNHMRGDLSETEFIEQIRRELRKGLGLVPFIGSGCSADSGILMGSQFTDYLGYVVWRCLEPNAGDVLD